MAGQDLYSLSEDHRREQREQQENVRLSIANQQQYDPDRARRILAVSAATGLPNEVVDADLDNIEKSVASRQFDLDKWRKESPAWASFTSENPYNLAVLKEDQENMGTFERSFKQLGMGWDSTWATVELGRLRSRQAGGDVREGDEARLKELKQLQVDHEFGAENWFAKFLVKNVKMAGPTFASIHRGVDLGLAGAVIGGSSAAIAGQMGPQALIPEEMATVPAAAALGFGVGFTTGSTQSAFELERGFAYDEYLEMGIDQETAKTAANSVGLVNAALESFGISRVVRYIPGFKGAAGKELVGEVLSRPTMRRATATAALRFGEVLGTEVVTEALQESVTAVTGEIVRPDGTGVPLSWDAYTDRITDVMLETMQGAFLMSTIGPGASYYTDARRAHQAKNMQSVYRALGEAAENSSTRQNVPEKYREFVERLTKDGPVEHMLIDVDRFTEYWQEIGQDPDEIAAEMGIDLNEARAAGVDLEIPIEQYADKIAPTEHHAALAPDLKVRSDQMSARESEEWYKNADELQKAMADQEVPDTHTPNQEIHDAVMGELLSTGTEMGAADKQATLTEYVFSTLAERNNMDAMELFDRYWGGVTKSLPEVLQKGAEDIDMLVDPLLDRLRAGEVPGQRDIFGESLTDFLKVKGGLVDEGGELAARDVKKEFRGLIKESGLTLDAAAELASEAGFIAEFDSNQLLDALEREIRGDPVFGRGADPMVADLARSLEELSDLIEREGIDLEGMSNAQIRKLLEGDRTLNQDELDEVLEMAILSAAHDPALLSRALASMPGVSDVQDFGNLAFVDRVSVEGLTEVVEIEDGAQKIFDRAIKRRETIKRLLDCVSG